MKNQRFNRNIFGDLPTQKMAQEALPILVSYAQKCETITLRELAAEIAPHLTQFNRAMAWVFCWIHTTLYELERQDNWEYGEIPHITAIAVASRETPTTWMDQQTRVDPRTPLSWKDYETHHILPVFKYPHWDKVIDFTLPTVAEFNANLDEVNFNNFIIDKGQFGSEPEEEEQEIPEDEHRYFVYAWRCVVMRGSQKLVEHAMV